MSGVSRKRLVLLIVGLIGLVVVAGLALMLRARQPLEDARASMEAGRRSLLDGDAAGATSRFADAEASFSDAHDRLSNPLTRAAALVPLIGRTPDALIAAADAGSLAAQAGRGIADAIGTLPGGVGALAPRDGTIPLEPIETVAPSFGRARDLLLEADATVSDVPTGMVPGPVSEPFEELRSELTDALGTLTAAARLSEVLPAFLGSEGPRTYFVGAQNPAELRGTGGLIGAFTTMTVDDGRMDLGPFRPIQELAGADGIEPPNPDYAARYDRFGGAGFWLNINMTPDFPSAATAIERLWAATQEQPVDGTIVADPEALALLMEGGPPVDVPGSDLTVDAETLVPFVTNEAYEVFREPPVRKRLLGEVAGQVLGRFLSGAGDPVQSGRALADVVGGGHLMLHAAEPGIQDAFEAAGASGRLLDPAGDYLAVVANNAAGNKVDFYLDRSIRHEVALQPDGRAEVTTEITFVNEAPSEGVVPYVIGPFEDVSAAGEQVMFLSVYAPGDARLLGAEENGQPGTGGIEHELGHPVAWTNLRIASGDTATLRYRWRIPEVWTGTDRAGLYRLTFQRQPTIRPTRLEVRVSPPPGTELRGGGGLRLEDGVAVWSGTPDDVERIEVAFARPAASRVVSDLLPGPLL